MNDTAANDDAAIDGLLTFFEEQCYLKRDSLTRETELFSSGRLASLDFIDLIAYVEETFGVKVPSDDASYENFDTIDRILAYIRSRG